MLFLIFIVYIFFYALALTNATRRAIIHIGPSKTATTHIQFYLVDNKISLESEGLIARWINRDGLQNIFARDGELSVAIDEAHKKDYDLIVSSEFLATYNEPEVQKLKDMLSGFNEIIIVWTFREALSRTISRYNEHCHKLFVPSFASFALSKMKHTPTIEPYVTVFGSDQIRILDYYGIVASNVDIVHVVLCLIAEYHCKETLQLSTTPNHGKQSVHHENSSKDYKLLPLFHYVTAANDCSDSRRIVHSWNIFRNKMLATNISLPMVSIDMEILQDKAVQQNAIIQSNFKDMQWYFRNEEENVAVCKSAEYTELATWEILKDPSWRQWLQEIMDWYKSNKASLALC